MPDPIPPRPDLGDALRGRPRPHTSTVVVASLTALAMVAVMGAVVMSSAARIRHTRAICEQTRVLLHDVNQQSEPGGPVPTHDLSRFLPTRTTLPSVPLGDQVWSTSAEVAEGRTNASGWIEHLDASHFQGGIWRQWHGALGGSSGGRPPVRLSR
jgi:hypothetical protein